MSDKKNNKFYGTGRRKSSVARVFLVYPGSGEITVNNKPFVDYFSRKTDHQLIRQSFHVVDQLNRFNAYITVSGGGTTGQAQAIRHAVARALIDYEEKELSHAQGSDGDWDLSFRRRLRHAGFVTRDPRRVERKRYGFRKARKRRQYSKR